MQSGYEETELALPKLSAASARRTSWPFSTTQGPAQGSPRPPSGPERVHSTDEERGLRENERPESPGRHAYGFFPWTPSFLEMARTLMLNWQPWSRLGSSRPGFCGTNASLICAWVSPSLWL